MKIQTYSLLFIIPVALFLASCNNPTQTETDNGDDGYTQDGGWDGTFPAVSDDIANTTIYQAFYWDAYPGLWSDLPAMAKPLADAGITAMWLPPAAKGMNGGDSVGYDVYDFWDLGEFNQKDTNPTRYGTRIELESAITELNGLGIDAYFDVVFNHRMGGDSLENVPTAEGSTVDGADVSAWTQFNLQGRNSHYTSAKWGDLYHDFSWDWRAFNGVDYYDDAEQDNPVLFEGKGWPNTYGSSYLMGTDVDYWYRLNDSGEYDVNGTNWAIRDEMMAWGEWIINDVGFAGFRMDATAHVDNAFVAEWVDHLQEKAFPDRDIFFVAEAWVGNVGDYLNTVDDATHRASDEQLAADSLRAFDFSLRGDFVDLSSGSKDMRNWGGLANTPFLDSRAVTFVDNHDTSREGNPYNTPQVTNYKHQAYAYMLMRQWGVPTVYARDWDEFNMAPKLTRLIQARRYFAYGDGHEHDGNTQEVYAYIREGRDDIAGTGLVMLISGRDSGGTESMAIDSRQPDTTFVDITGNVDGTVTTNSEGVGNFQVHMSEATGWSVWVPQL